MLKDIFTFNGRWGRLNRLRYLGYNLLIGLLLMIVILGTSFGAMGLGMVDVNDEGAIMIFTVILNLIILPVSIWTSICLISKRWHDLDKSAWYGLLFLVPLVSFVAALYLLFAKGSEGDNQYGPDPIAQS